MWIRIINKLRYGYDTYINCCNDTDRYEIYFDGLFFKKII